MIALVTGSGGQLGHDVAECLAYRGYEVLAPKRGELDFSDEGSVRAYFSSHSPDMLFHCGAWTNVDLAETETDACRRTNVDGTRFLAEECARLDIPILYISTDYVFNGSGERPWRTDDPTSPINQYGLSKRDGENEVLKYSKHYIVRISWVFGSNGKNFVRTMMNLSKKTDTVRVVNDQIGSLTYTADLAPLLIDIMKSGKYGIYHAHNSGCASWYEVACEIFRILGTGTNVVPISSDDYPMKATRPHNSRLDTSSLTENGFSQLPDWKDAVLRYIRHNEKL